MDREPHHLGQQGGVYNQENDNNNSIWLPLEEFLHAALASFGGNS